MTPPNQNSTRALQRYEPPSAAVYTIESAAHLAQVPRRMVLVYCKHGLVSPAEAEASIGYRFDGAAIRSLRRMEELRTRDGINLAGLKMVLSLMGEIEALRARLGARRPGRR
jgi:DNA-binding transcriptional MerR regulator